MPVFFGFKIESNKNEIGQIFGKKKIIKLSLLETIHDHFEY